MGNYDSNDCRFSWSGDFAKGKDGDLGDTSEDGLLSLIQEIHSVVKSELLDWQMEPTLGAGLSEFIGEPNTEETGRKITNRLRTKLVEAKIVDAGDLHIRVVPVNIGQVMIMINVMAVATSNNRLDVGQSINISFLFDTSENGLFFFPPSIHQANNVR